MNKNFTNGLNKKSQIKQANRFNHNIYGMSVISTTNSSFSELVKQIEDERQVVYCQSKLLKNRPSYEKDLHLCLN